MRNFFFDAKKTRWSVNFRSVFDAAECARYLLELMQGEVHKKDVFTEMIDSGDNNGSIQP